MSDPGPICPAQVTPEEYAEWERKWEDYRQTDEYKRQKQDEKDRAEEFRKSLRAAIGDSTPEEIREIMKKQSEESANWYKEWEEGVRQEELASQNA